MAASTESQYKKKKNSIFRSPHTIGSATPDSRSILITGGAGFVGSHLAAELLRSGHRVTAVDNFVTGRLQNTASLRKFPNFSFYKADINSSVFLRRFSHMQFDEIYHLACPTGVPNIQRLAEEMLRTSSAGTFAVLELGRLHKAGVVFSSSCEIYGQPEVTPQHEHYTGNVDPIGPRSPYEEGKRFSESVVAMYARKYGVQAKIVRFFNVYGPNMAPQDQRVIPQFFYSTLSGNSIKIYGDGTQTRTFLYVDDVVRGLRLVMAKGEAGEAYNIGSTTPITMRDLAATVAAVTGHPQRAEYVPHFIEDHNHRCPSVEKISTLGWQQEISLDEGLRRMLSNADVTVADQPHIETREPAEAV